MPSNSQAAAVNADLLNALGLPPKCIEATLRLRAGELPTVSWLAYADPLVIGKNGELQKCIGAHRLVPKAIDE